MALVLALLAVAAAAPENAGGDADSPYTASLRRPTAVVAESDHAQVFDLDVVVARKLMRVALDMSDAGTVRVPDPFQPDPSAMLYFMHIPKTGGTTFDSYLKNISRAENLRYQFVSPTQPKSKELNDDTKDFFKTKPVVKVLSVEAHWEYPVVIPARDPALRVLRSTFIREPFERMRSQLKHEHRRDRMLWARTVNDAVNPELCSKHNACSHDRFHNKLTKCMVGQVIWQLHLEGQYSEEDMLALAANHLIDIEFFGLTDYFDASVCLFLHTFSFERQFAESCEDSFHHVAAENVAGDGQSGGEEDSKRKERNNMAHKANALDAALYQVAEDVFRRRMCAFQAKVGRIYAPDIDCSGL